MSRALARIGRDAPARAEVRYPSAGQRMFAALEHKQLYVASVLGLSVSVVSRLQSGQRQPTLEQVLAIEDCFKIPPRYWRVDGLAKHATSSPGQADHGRAGSSP